MPSSAHSIRSCPMTDDGPSGMPLSDDAIRGFVAIRAAAAAQAVNLYDRDAFLMLRPVVELIHASRPEGGVGVGIDLLAAVTHLTYLFWAEGSRVERISDEVLRVILSGNQPPAHPPTRPPAYLALVGHRVWGSPTDTGPEPLDGWFAAREGDLLQVAALFGGRPDRGGASVVAVDGADPVALARLDGTPLFAPTLEGGHAAGLYSITGMEELLALAWRVEHWRGGGA